MKFTFGVLSWSQSNQILNHHFFTFLFFFFVYEMKFSELDLSKVRLSIFAPCFFLMRTMWKVPLPKKKFTNCYGVTVFNGQVVFVDWPYFRQFFVHAFWVNEFMRKSLVLFKYILEVSSTNFDQINGKQWDKIGSRFKLAINHRVFPIDHDFSICLPHTNYEPETNMICEKIFHRV